MISAGFVALVVGLLLEHFTVGALATLGYILVVVGIVALIVGLLLALIGHLHGPVAGRRHYW